MGAPQPLMSAEELRALPVSVNLKTAGRAFGIGSTKAGELARDGKFPVPVLRLGRKYRVSRAEILRALGIDDTDETDDVDDTEAAEAAEQQQPA